MQSLADLGTLVYVRTKHSSKDDWSEAGADGDAGRSVKKNQAVCARVPYRAIVRLPDPSMKTLMSRLVMRSRRIAQGITKMLVGNIAATSYRITRKYITTSCFQLALVRRFYAHLRDAIAILRQRGIP